MEFITTAIKKAYDLLPNDEEPKRVFQGYEIDRHSARWAYPLPDGTYQTYLSLESESKGPRKRIQVHIAQNPLWKVSVVRGEKTHFRITVRSTQTFKGLDVSFEDGKLTSMGVFTGYQKGRMTCEKHPSGGIKSDSRKLEFFAQNLPEFLK